MFLIISFVCQIVLLHRKFGFLDYVKQSLKPDLDPIHLFNYPFIQARNPVRYQVIVNKQAACVAN